MLVGLALVLLGAWVAAVVVTVRLLRQRRTRRLTAARTRFAVWREVGPATPRRPRAPRALHHHGRRPARPVPEVALLAAVPGRRVRRLPAAAPPQARVHRPRTCEARHRRMARPTGLVGLLARPVVEMFLLVAGLVTWILAVTHAGPSSAARVLLLLAGVVAVYVVDGAARAQSHTGQSSAEA